MTFRGGGEADRVRQTQFELEFFETEDGDQPARRWMQELAPTKRRALGYAMYRILAQEGVNVCSTEWGRSLGEGLYEFRLRDEIERQGETARILLRVFFHPYGDKRILLLGGYDKGEHPSAQFQQKRIAEARTRLNDVRLRQRREGSQTRGQRR